VKTGSITKPTVVATNKRGWETKREVRKMERMMDFFRGEEGVTAIEYSLIAALIAIVIIAMVTAAGEQVVAVFTRVRDALTAALA